ncbi:MAG: adenylyltransferase/cytidyltransferase family protein, partial [Patescibacteria group bacterium]
MKNTPPDAASKVVSYKKAAEISRRLKQQGKKIVFKTGCFDIFHIAHARALQHSKGLGDVLFVGVGSDKTLRALKGSARPIFPEK